MTAETDYTDGMQYFFLTLSVLAAAANNTMLHLPLLKRSKVNEFVFNIGVAAVWIVLLFAVNGGVHGFSPRTALFGLLYGIVLAGFLFCKMQAFANGPVHLTSLVGSSSFILTTVFNAVYWKEKVSGWQIAGILTMLAAVFAITWRPHRAESDKKQKPTGKWAVYAGAFFFFSALTGIIFRFHQAADAVHTDEMMIFASAVVIAFLGILSAGSFLFKRRGRMNAENCRGGDANARDGGDANARDGGDANARDGAGANARDGIPVRRRTLALCALTAACGVAGCVYNRLNIYLSGAMANAVFFPLFNGGNIILSSLAGRIFFREKLSGLQIVGIVCGMFAVILVSDCFGLL